MWGSATRTESRILANSPRAYTGCTTDLGLIGCPSNWSRRYRATKCRCGIEFFREFRNSSLPPPVTDAKAFEVFRA